MTLSSKLVPRPDIVKVPIYSRASASVVPVTIRASSNEAPFGPAESVQQAVVQRLETANLYPQIGGEDLNLALCKALGVSADEVISADGSLSLLNYLLLTYCRPGDQVVYSWRSYEAYPICVRTAGAVPVPVPNSAEGGHDLEGMLKAINASTAAVIVCSPNNPTGAHVTQDELKSFLDRVPTRILVVLDEAYCDFDLTADAPDALALHRQYANLVVLRTFSKARGLAGLRVGYAFGAPDVIRNVNRILPPFPVNALGVAAALASLQDDEFRLRTVRAIVKARVDLEERAKRLGLSYVQSHANFVWFPLGDESSRLGQACAEQGMSVRVFPQEGTRISVGFPGVGDAFERAIAALGQH